MNARSLPVPEFHPISEHGVVGDMRTLALVAIDGTIDFFCQPDIDSPSLFAALLDREAGGFFRLGIGDGEMRHRQIYLPDTNILITRFLGNDGIGEVTDLMPLDGSGRLVRRAMAISGDAVFNLAVVPRPDYARAKVAIRAIRGGASLHWSEGKEEKEAFLYCSHPLRIEGGAIFAEIALKEGELAHAVFCPGRPDQSGVDAAYVDRAFNETRNFWHAWVQAGTYPTFWRELVVRSALTLKLLTSQKHGSIAAAATFGLPEVLGGERNWDYRYCWVRDSAFTVYSLSRLGYFDEAADFVKFLMARVVEREGSGMQIMYAMDGHDRLEESSLDHLAGFLDSKPVRIGNAAYNQIQMDIFGEFLDAVYIASKARGKPSFEVWRKIRHVLDWLSGNWHLPDNGIWESRGEPREYLSSRLMCWVALDRGIRISRSLSLPADIERWRTERDRIQGTIIEDFWNEKVGAFTQYKGADGLDAVVLLMPLVKFIDPRDPMWISTLKAVQRELVHDCLVQRYTNTDENPDGLGGREGAFTICSFWYVEALARTGYVADARFLFEKLHAYANHLGLYSEELSASGDHLGNFPQGLTHLSLISAAIWLDRALTSSRNDLANVHFHPSEDPHDLN